MAMSVSVLMRSRADLATRKQNGRDEDEHGQSRADQHENFKGRTMPRVCLPPPKINARAQS